MANDEITLERFARLLEAYGASAARWPEAERPAALALLDRSAAAQTLRAEAATLDAALDRAPAEAPSAALLGAVLAARPQPATGWWRSLFGPLPIWQPAAALVLAAILGLGLGSTGALSPPGEEVVVVDVASLGFAGDELDSLERE